MMRNILYATFAAVSLAMCLTACNDDDDKADEQVNNCVKANFVLKAESNVTFQESCDMNLSYKVTDANGKSQSDVITVTDSLIISNIDCPCSITMSVTYAPKSVTFTDTQKYVFEFGPEYYVSTSNGHATKGGGGNYIAHTGVCMRTLLNALQTREYSKVINVDRYGNIVLNSNSEDDDLTTIVNSADEIASASEIDVSSENADKNSACDAKKR